MSFYTDKPDWTQLPVNGRNGAGAPEAQSPGGLRHLSDSSRI
jgi:hypothetical protein